ncbi:MAG: alpha/beta hydrolase [Cyanobacteria bacterium P01_A01_bin.84]
MKESFKLKIDSAKIVGECSGEGESLIFLHAGVADRRMWCYQIAQLSNSYQVVTYDRRGFGETITTDESFSHIEDLQEVLFQLDISTASLIGCSQGGRIAIDFTLAYPERVNALVLIAPALSGAPVPSQFAPEIQARMEELDEAEKMDNLERINAIEANLWLDGAISSPGRVGGTLKELFLDMNGIALKKPELTKEIEPTSAYERLSNLSLPTLVIWGELDFPHIKQRCKYIVNTIPDARGEEIPGTAHLPSLEKPEVINKLLQDFFN